MADNHSVDFIGVGAEKTGSSWLYKCLLEHPQICGIEGKEATFFDTTKIFGRPDRTQSDYEKYGIKRYQEYFNHCPIDSVKGEFSTTYLHDKSVAKKIFDNFPKTKIIINLRNPVDKSFAMYIGAKEVHGYKTFENALSSEPEFTRRSMYSEYVAEYFKYFSRENILINFYEDIEKDPLAFVQNVYSFLDVESSFIPSFINKRLDSERHKLLTAFRNKLLRNPVMKIIIELSRKLRVNKLFKFLTSLLVSEPHIQPATRKILLEKFKPDIFELEQILNKKINWN